MPPRKGARSPRPSRRSADAQRRQLEAASELIDRAWDEDDPEVQVALAFRALQISPDCADAYLFLAEFAPTDQEALQLHEQAVEAAVRAIGPDRFREFTGHFWGIMETRPYMRARLELAESLLQAGRVDEAVDHYRELLKLNPNDNQGCRHRLAAVLLRSDRLDELEGLLREYPNDSLADWTYTRALLEFKRHGDTDETRTLLRRAEQGNPHVPAFLAGARQLPRELPEFFSPGEETEAIGHAAGFLPAWRETPGAIPWLRKTLNVPVHAPRTPRRPAWSRLKAALERLPQAEDSIWEVDLVPLSADARDRAWALLIVDVSSRELLLSETWSERPRDPEVWQQVIDTMRQPESEEPSRPAAIQVTRKTWHRGWGPKLQQIGIECQLLDELPTIPAVVEQIATCLPMSGASDGEDLPAAPAELRALPQETGEEWVAVLRKLPAWIHVGGQPCRPAVALVLDATNDLLLAAELTEAEPPEDWFWTKLARAMSRPGAGEPRRPGKVFVAPPEALADVGPRLAASAIDAAGIRDDQRQFIDEILTDLTDRIAGTPRMTALVHAPGITPGQLVSFYAAAADYYRQAPWRRIPGDTIVRVETDAFSSSVWYAVVMGQSGMQLGLALYEDLEALRLILSGRMSDEENARRTSAVSVTFGEVFEISPEDLDAIAAHRWPIAAEEAYPCVLRVKPGATLRTPLVWEIELLEACLRAMPGFVKSGAHRESQSVNTSTREVRVQLSIGE